MLETHVKLSFAPRFGKWAKSRAFLIFWKIWWCRGVVVITTAQLHSTKPELGFCVGLNPVCGVSEIRNGEDL